jgi:HEAT repeat protein
MKETKDVDGLIKDLRNTDVKIRRDAAQALGFLRDPRSVEPLCQCLVDKEVRHTAASSLSMIPDPRAVRYLLPLFIDEDRAMREKAGNALCEIALAHKIDLKNVEDARSLIKALSDKYSNIRQKAFKVLGRILIDGRPWGHRTEEERVWYLLAGEKWGELVGIGAPAIRPLVQAIRNDLSDAELSLHQAEMYNAYSGSKYLARDRIYQEVMEELEALANIKDPMAEDELIVASKDYKLEIRVSAIRALGNISSEKAAEAIIQTLQDERTSKTAYNTLKHMGKPAIPPLTRALGHQNEKVRKNAQELLEWIEKHP